jgi:P4 family phage/plasmid primase-like protien
MTSDPYYNHDLRKFLDDHRVASGKGNEISMTGMGTHKGSWFISDAEYPKFLDLMYTYLFEDEFRPNNFVEQRKADGIAPLLIDLDFKYNKEKNLQRTFTDKHISDFVGEIIKILKEYFDLKDRTQLRFFVTLRSAPYIDSKTKNDDEKIKDGVHIACPDFSIGKEHYTFIRDKLLESKALEESFADTYYTNKAEKVFDECMGNKQGWFFYGESKMDILPYLLSNVLKYNPKTGKITQDTTEYTPRQLLEVLSIRYSLNKPLSVLDAHKDTIEKAVLKAKNPVLAMVPSPTADEIIGILPILIDSFNTIVTTEDEIVLAKRFALECLSTERADSYDSWMRVGWCLYHIDPSEDMFKVWMKFSEKSAASASNNVDALRRDWMKGSMRRVNGSMEIRMGTLKMWARGDNPVKYSEIMDGDIISYITKVALTFKGGTHYHVAMMIMRLFPDLYKCAVDGRSTEWYEFKNHIWNHMPNGILIKALITNETGTAVTSKVDSARNSLVVPDIKKMTQEEFNEKMKNYNDNMGKMLKLQENLYNATFKDSVIKEAVQLFYDQEFTKQINQNPYKLGCANGILNLKEPIFDEEGKAVKYKPTLYPGVAEDYVSLCVGQKGSLGPINYVPYDPADPIYLEIMDFFTKLFPAEDLRDYVLTLLAGCLEGANKEQCFYLMTGSGGNGKSKLVELMCSVMGQYSGSLSTTALTRKRPDSGAANPDIICVKGCRFIETKEPDEGEPLNSARMKQFSGEDLVEARALFKDQESFKITGKIFMSCNRMPPVHSMDGGTWRRIRVIPFDSRFVDPNEFPVDEENHVYARDDMMEEKLLSWRVPFFSLLVHLYETRYCVGRIKVPAVVMQACENYKGNFDSFGKFHKSRLRKAPGWDEPPQFNDIWRSYRTWTADENPTGKKLTQNELKIRLNEIYQVPADGKTYKHIRLFFSEEEIEEFDKEVSGEAI